MTMFPGANAQVYYNEAGEPLGWDYPSHDEPSDPYDDYDRCNYDPPEPENVEQCIEWKMHAKDGYGENGWWVCDYCHQPYAEIPPEDVEEWEEHHVRN